MYVLETVTCTSSGGVPTVKWVEGLTGKTDERVNYIIRSTNAIRTWRVVSCIHNIAGRK